MLSAGLPPPRPPPLSLFKTACLTELMVQGSWDTSHHPSLGQDSEAVSHVTWVTLVIPPNKPVLGVSNTLGRKRRDSEITG